MHTFSKIKSKDTVTIYYIGEFLTSFASSLAFAIYAVFLFSSGLNLLQINMVGFAFMITVFLLQVPTGAFADALGRKNSTIIAYLLVAIGYFFYPTFRIFWAFVLAEIMVAVGKSFASGAYDAWMVDSQNLKGNVDFIFSRRNIVSKAAMIFGGLAGAYLAKINIAYPFYVGSILAMLSVIFFAIFMREDTHFAKVRIKEAFGKISRISRDAIGYCAGHRVIPWLIVGAVVFNFVFQPMNMYWSPRFNGMLGDQIQLLGWIWTGFCLMMIAGSYLTQYMLKKKKSYTFILIVNVLLVAIPVVVSAISRNILVALPAILIYEISRGIEGPAQLAYLNRFAEEKMRSTILSFESMMASLGAAAGLFLFGLLAKNTSIEMSWIAAGIFSLILIPIFLRAKTKEGN